MEAFIDCREQIYNHFHESELCFTSISDDVGRFAQYYTSMYLLQDTSESIWHHRQRGFSANPLEAYIELWGVMQAVIIHQDSLSELYFSVIEKQLDYSQYENWKAIRRLRNEIAGHPANRDRPPPLTRSFLARGFGNYNKLTYERWSVPENHDGSSDEGMGYLKYINNPNLELGVLIDSYVLEAVQIGNDILNFMQVEWPSENA